MSLEQIYLSRFSRIDQQTKLQVWREISTFIYRKMGSPQKVLDPACGEGEFLIHIPAKLKHGIDLRDTSDKLSAYDVKFKQDNSLTIPLEKDFYEGIFVSNFLEHLESTKEIKNFLEKLNFCLSPNGILALMGPNFKYCFREYYDYSDHHLPLTHLSVCEHLFSCNFEVLSVFPQFLPFSFNSHLPKSPRLVRYYLKFPFFWKILGKQFLILAKKKS